MATPGRSSHTALRLSRKWHDWLGLGTALLLALSALSGIYLNHKDLFTPGQESTHRRKPVKALEPLATTSKVPFDPTLALHQARTLWGDLGLEHVQLKQEAGGLAWRIKGTDGREVHVDATDGKVLYQRGPRANHTLNKVILDLHTGEIVSLPGRLLIDAGALGMLILTGTGLYLWWKPRRIRAAKAGEKEARTTAPPTAAGGGLPGPGLRRFFRALRHPSGKIDPCPSNSVPSPPSS